MRNKQISAGQQISPRKQGQRVANRFKNLVLICAITATLYCTATISTSRLQFSQEENINGLLFKHQLDIENGLKNEKYFVQYKQVTAPEYEEAIEQAEKEVRKRERAQQQEET